MKRAYICAAVLAGLIVVMGCDQLAGILMPHSVTVRLVNSGGLPVDVELFYDDQQETIRSLLTQIGEEIDTRVAAGSTYSFTRDCDELQAIVIDRAEVSIIGDIGPSQDSEVLRDGDDFSCGDTITFTFEYAEIPLSLDISVSVTPGITYIGG